MRRVLVLAMMMAGLRCGVAVSQGKPAAAAALVITLEKKGADGVAVPMAADHVFSAGDTIRFRVVSQFDGYVYVMDQGTSGKFATLFPAGDTGSDNRVHKLQTLLVPATDDGWFEVANPPGFDVLYFLLSPEPIATPPAAAFVAPGPVSSLRPKCNDAIFKARGECVDATAGPRRCTCDGTAARAAGAVGRCGLARHHRAEEEVRRDGERREDWAGAVYVSAGAQVARSSE